MAGIGGDYISKALRETLDSVVSPEVRQRILRAALDAESLSELPTSPWRFRQFVQGALAEAVHHFCGAELAEPVLEELSRIADIAERDHAARTGSFPPDFEFGTRPESSIQLRYQEDLDDCKTDPYQYGQLELLLDELKQFDLDDEPPSSRDYPLGTANALGVIGTAVVERGGRAALPLVLVATADLDLLRSFSAWLDPRASVQRVPNLLAMIGELREAGGRRVVLVIDARSPSVKPLAMAALADDLPDTTRVVLWGMSGENYAKMMRLSPAVSHWLLCGVDCPTSEVVAQCVRLVG